MICPSTIKQQTAPNSAIKIGKVFSIVAPLNRQKEIRGGLSRGSAGIRRAALGSASRARGAQTEGTRRLIEIARSRARSGRKPQSQSGMP